MSQLNHTRVYDVPNKRMFNFIKSLDSEGNYVVTTDDDCKELIMRADFIEVQTFICKYDNTTWNMLQHWEKEFWAKKGYTEENWQGKEMYIGDICKCVQDGNVEKAFVIQFEHQVCLLKPDETIKEISCDPKKGKLYVIGNVLENPFLLTNENLMHERRKEEEDRREEWRGDTDRRTASETMATNPE